MARDSKLEFTVNKKEKALVVAAAKAEDKSSATFIRDAVINKAMKVVR